MAECDIVRHNVIGLRNELLYRMRQPFSTIPNAYGLSLQQEKDQWDSACAALLEEIQDQELARRSIVVPSSIPNQNHWNLYASWLAEKCHFAQGLLNAHLQIYQNAQFIQQQFSFVYQHQ